jgi:checkpoint serine/threonine-protein kinase
MSTIHQHWSITVLLTSSPILQADCCSDPSDILEFLEANDIGQDYALFYEAYATSMEVRRKFARADEIYNLGLQR